MDKLKEEWKELFINRCIKNIFNAEEGKRAFEVSTELVSRGVDLCVLRREVMSSDAV